MGFHGTGGKLRPVKLISYLLAHGPLHLPAGPGQWINSGAVVALRIRYPPVQVVVSGCGYLGAVRGDQPDLQIGKRNRFIAVVRDYQSHWQQVVLTIGHGEDSLLFRCVIGINGDRDPLVLVLVMCWIGCRGMQLRRNKIFGFADRGHAKGNADRESRQDYVP